MKKIIGSSSSFLVTIPTLRVIINTLHHCFTTSELVLDSSSMHVKELNISKTSAFQKTKVEELSRYGFQHLIQRKFQLCAACTNKFYYHHRRSAKFVFRVITERHMVFIYVKKH